MHPLFYFVLLVSALTGQFRSIVIFTIIIIVHELGHFLTAYLLKWQIKKIVIYPYGGCSEFDEDVNVPLWEEFLVLIMGPIVQIIFVSLLSYFVDSINLDLFQRYSYWLLIFNLLPIFPLDGGKLVQIILSYFTSYYRSYQFTIYFSYLFLLSIGIIFSFYFRNFVLILIFILLAVSLFQEIKKAPFFYRRFLLERYLYEYSFKRKKSVLVPEQMKRDTIHVINKMPEREYLKQLF